MSWLALQVTAEAVVLEEPLGEKEPLLVELQARSSICLQGEGCVLHALGQYGCCMLLRGVCKHVPVS